MFIIFEACRYYTLHIYPYPTCLSPQIIIMLVIAKVRSWKKAAVFKFNICWDIKYKSVGIIITLIV